MDPYSSGEKLNIKTRKPYTITKQRERWTEDEHNSFLEALKLYGRAWQRIEEHIGTKTAVQIRSHAQKFFTKLEKEALAKGVPIRQALDMEIPPPRPKRKPSYPYPRKTGPKTHPHVAEKDGEQATLVSSIDSGKCILDLDRKPLPETTKGDAKQENAEINEEMENSMEGLLPQETLCVSLSSENQNSISRPAQALNPCAFREFVPALQEVINHDETNASYMTIETRKHQKLHQDDIKHTNNTSNTLFTGDSHLSHDNSVQGHNADKLSQPGSCGAQSINDIQGLQNYPRHVPVQIVDGNQGNGAKENVPQEMSFQESALDKLGEVHEYPNLFVNIAASATTGHHNCASRSSSYQTVPTFHPLFMPFCDNQEDYSSFLHVSSTISSLIVSSLLQNPAAHAAASFAATFWHPANGEASSGDSSSRRDHPSVQLNSETPSMAAIAAATVAAATAWWAAHGLLPVCAPFYPGYSSTSQFPFGTPMDGNQARVANNGRENTTPEGIFQEEKMDAEQSEGLPKKHPPSKSAALSSSEDSEKVGDRKLNTELSAADTKEMVSVAELHDSSKTNVQKQVDRSSCGSNTTSSSEIETDALEKHGKEKEETKESDVNLPCNDSIFRRSRSSISPSESWKEVSEEGRLAFQALFSRDVLPQSFPHTHIATEKDQQIIVENSEAASQLDLNRVTGSSREPGKSNAFALLRGERNGEEGLLTMGQANVKLNVHHTGFKPYKRCSIEAKESQIASTSTGNQNNEKGPKRMRLEAEAST